MSAVLATTGLTVGPLRGGVAAGSSGSGTAWCTWLLAGGGWLLVAVVVLVAGTHPAPGRSATAGPRSTTGGRWTRKLMERA